MNADVTVDSWRGLEWEPMVLDTSALPGFPAATRLQRARAFTKAVSGTWPSDGCATRDVAVFAAGLHHCMHSSDGCIALVVISVEASVHGPDMPAARASPTHPA